MLRRMFALMIAVALICSVRISSTNAQQLPSGGYYAFVETTGTASGTGGCYCVNPNGIVYEVAAETATLGFASATQVSFIPVGFFNGTEVQAYTSGMTVTYTIGSTAAVKGKARMESSEATLDIVDDLFAAGPGSYTVSYTTVNTASYAPSQTTLMSLTDSIFGIAQGEAGFIRSSNGGGIGATGMVGAWGFGSSAISQQIIDPGNADGAPANNSSSSSGFGSTPFSWSQSSGQTLGTTQAGISYGTYSMGEISGIGEYSSNSVLPVPRALTQHLNAH